MARDVSPIEGQNCGIAPQPSQNRHPRCIVLRKLFRERDFFRFIVYRIFSLIFSHSLLITVTSDL